MRVKKQKRHRRAVRFYTACYGFREPFKILCDGTFVHHLLTNRITPADTALTNILGGSVKIFTSRCVLEELKRLGDSYSATVNAAENLMIARCEHEKRKSAVECVTEIIGDKNLEHFFVATQDADLRRKFQEIPGVPTIYGLRNALFLDCPSTLQREFAKTAEEERSRLTDLEYKLLKKKRVRESSDANEDTEDRIVDTYDHNTSVKRNIADTKDKAKFKKNRAKGPNPLSCKKKKTQVNVDTASKKEKSDDSSTRSRSRKRKRTRKNTNPLEATV